jgi:hypothetical protein
MKKYGVNDYFLEAPAIGAVMGGLMAGGGTLAGMMSISGLMGAALGAVGTTMLTKSMAPDSGGGGYGGGGAQAPAMPGAPSMPQLPQAPAMNSPTDGSAPSTPEDIAKGEANNRKRRGRLSTILTGPQDRGDQSGGEEIELLGG